MLKPGWAKIVSATTIGFLVLCVAAWQSGFQGEVCQYSEAAKREDCAVYGFLPFLIIKFGKFLDDYSSAITALATVAIGCFTYTLKRSTDKLFGATEVAANAAEKAASVSESALRDVERAYVYMTDAKLIGSQEGLLINIQWKNSGSTWTQDAIHHLSWALHPTALPGDFNFPDLGTAAGQIFIAPNGVRNAGPVTVSTPQMVAVMSGRAFLYLWGWIEYDDIFEHTPRHRSEFCVQIFPEQHVLAPNGSGEAVASVRIHNLYNGADNDCQKPVQTASKKNPLNIGLSHPQ